MPFKNKSDNVDYHKRYYINNKQKYAYSKRLNYWRKKMLACKNDSNISQLTVEELKSLYQTFKNSQ